MFMKMIESEIDSYKVVTKSNDDYFESYEDFTVSKIIYMKILVFYVYEFCSHTNYLNMLR